FLQEAIPSEFIGKSDDDATQFSDSFNELIHFIERALDIHKPELSGVLYPVFVHLYLRLVSADKSADAVAFYNRFGPALPAYHRGEEGSDGDPAGCGHLQQLRAVTRPGQVATSPVLEGFRSGQYTVILCKDSHRLLKQFLAERPGQPVDSAMDHVTVEEVDGPPRSRQAVESRRGALLGEAGREANRARILYAAAGKKAKPDPNAPAPDRIPLPELRDRDRVERRQRARDLQKRQRLGPQSMPSCCLYTAHNSSDERVTACDISEDGLLLCCGTEHSAIKAWALSSRDGLEELLSAEELDKLDTSDDGVHLRMLADKHSMCRQLLGHSGSVYSVSIAPNKQLLVSGSSDTTVRLWSLQLWSCLVVLRGHHEPVWSVRFSPMGHYFASGGADWVARLWATDHCSPLRLFCGHLGDVDCVRFHPNGNYVATGSSDGMVRLFDVLNGRCVRAMSGHKGAPACLDFSGCGRFLITGCTRGGLIVWDLAVTGGQVAHFTRAHDACAGGGVTCLAVCRDSQLLATGGLDSAVRLWDLAKLTAAAAPAAATASSSSTGSQQQQNAPPPPPTPPTCQFDAASVFVKALYTKRTPLLALHFNRTNVLLAAGYFSADE
uniref:WD_REPEATS_REGION domain-containing protein n=1 Tax=Macrostomum lignano TaxID=282301 RepID=A0A1I8GS39_9PLAT